MYFKEEFSFNKRWNESKRIRKKYPDRLPVICEILKTDIKNLILDKKKYLVPDDLTVGQFMYVIRKRIELPPEKAMFFFVNNSIPSAAQLIKQIYSEYQDKDGFLYFKVSGENTFG